MVKYFLLETDDNPGTSAEVERFDLPRRETSKGLILDITAQQNGTCIATRTGLASQIDQVRIGTAESNRVSEVDGEDLDAFNVLVGNHALFDAAACSDNSRVVHGMVYPFDQFIMSPQIDYGEEFGLTGNAARNLEIAYAADGSNVDDKRLAIGIVTVPESRTKGFVDFHRTAYCASNGSNQRIDVPEGGKLLGVETFETTGAADVTADGAHRTDQSVEEMAVTINRNDVLGPIYTTTAQQHNGHYEIGSISDEGYSLWNFGIFSRRATPGIPTNGEIGQNWQIRQLGGDAADAVRTYIIRQNRNV